MKRILLTFAILLAPYFAVAQTTLTTLQDGSCGRFELCTLAVADDANQAGTISLDNRNAGGHPLGHLTINTPDLVGSATGVYSGFTGNPDGSKNPFSGTGSYSGSGTEANGTPFTATGTFNYRATFVSQCGPRNPVCGWYYTIKAGSTVTVGQ